MVHLVYCDDAGKSGSRVLDKILSGQKTMVVRGAAGRKIPHSRVFAGEKLYFMQKGSAAVSACATVKSVQNYVKLNDSEINRILSEHETALSLSDKQRARWHKKCLCLVEFCDVKPIEPPLCFEKQSNMDDWLILEKIEDVLAGTSIPFNYDSIKLT